jgi:hypothetical protein
VNRAEAEKIYERGRDAVVEALLELDGRLHDRRERSIPGREHHHARHLAPLPDRFASVMLIPPSGERISAIVQEHTADALLIVVVVPVAPFTTEELAGMVLEYAIPEGRVRLAGSFSAPDRNTPELVRLESGSVVDVLQQREFFRVDATLTVHLVVGSSAEPLQTHTVNIGGGGTLLDAPRTLELGQPVKLEIALMPGDPPVRAAGRVVRTDRKGRPVVAFDAIDQVDRRRLVRFVTDRRLQEGFAPG